jgi:hypothetical protein
MEIGNLIFGNSRGEFLIERNAGFEKELIRLFKACAPDEDYSWHPYGVEFENDVFSISPYYWGECTCGHDQKDEQWREENDHQPDCPIVKPNFLYKPTGFRFIGTNIRFAIVI